MKSILRSQSAVEASRIRSVSEGGSGGLTGAAEPPHPITRLPITMRPAKNMSRRELIEKPRTAYCNNTRFEGVFAKRK
jgi:hypothetical protein